MTQIGTVLAAATEFSINRLLALDPSVSPQLDKMIGKVIRLELTDLGQNFYILPCVQEVQVLSQYEGEEDAHIKGHSMAMLHMSIREEASQSLFHGEVEILGDVDLGRSMSDLIKSVDIDWEEQLSKVSGDIVAHKVGNVVRSVGAWGKQSATILERDFAEFMHEESYDLPKRKDVELFLRKVDEIRVDADRLQARLQRLLKMK